MNLISMKRTKAELQETAEPSKVEQDVYPWGLCINVEGDALDKLGLEKLPEIGGKMLLVARVEVTSASSREVKGAKPHRSISLQITDMRLGDEPPDPGAAKALYGNEESTG